MSLDKDILFRELDTISEDIEFYLYERTMGNYSSWILCCGIDSLNILEETWEEIVDCFAIYFQANLKLEIERSNMYLVFFIESEITNKLKMQIEYDRYCCRKIIINEKYPELDDDRKNKIEGLIFRIEEYKEEAETKILSNWIENTDTVLWKIYVDFKNGTINIEDAFSQFSDIRRRT